MSNFVLTQPLFLARMPMGMGFFDGGTILFPGAILDYGLWKQDYQNNMEMEVPVKADVRTRIKAWTFWVLDNSRKCAEVAMETYGS